jgi:hypothetical protein
MRALILTTLLLTGCTRNACQIAVDQMQPAYKIPKTVNIKIGDSIKVDSGGQELLTNYVKMSNQVNSLVESCRSER